VTLRYRIIGRRENSISPSYLRYIGNVEQAPENKLGVRVQQFALDEVSGELLLHLKPLYDSTYHSSHMHASLLSDLERRPEVFQLFVAFLSWASPENAREGSFAPGKIIGARAIESKEVEGVDYLGLTPVYGKRFSVLPSFRSRGVGKQILDRCHEYCFSDLGLRAVFGTSAEIGALAMYGREGALYSLETIQDYSHKNSPEENVAFFREMLGNPVFKSYRLPGLSERDIRFAYCADDETRELLRANGYISKTDLMLALRDSPSLTV